jgi:hypothetical protein
MSVQKAPDPHAVIGEGDVGSGGDSSAQQPRFNLE